MRENLHSLSGRPRRVWDAFVSLRRCYAKWNEYDQNSNIEVCICMLGVEGGGLETWVYILIMLVSTLPDARGSKHVKNSMIDIPQHQYFD